MYKKALFIVSILICISLTGCGKDKEVSQTTKPVVESTKPESIDINKYTEIDDFEPVFSSEEAKDSYKQEFAYELISQDGNEYNDEETFNKKFSEYESKLKFRSDIIDPKYVDYIKNSKFKGLYQARINNFTIYQYDKYLLAKLDNVYFKGADSVVINAEDITASLGNNSENNDKTGVFLINSSTFANNPKAYSLKDEMSSYIGLDLAFKNYWHPMCVLDYPVLEDSTTIDVQEEDNYIIIKADYTSFGITFTYKINKDDKIVEEITQIAKDGQTTIVSRVTDNKIKDTLLELKKGDFKVENINDLNSDGSIKDGSENVSALLFWIVAHDTLTWQNSEDDNPLTTEMTVHKPNDNCIIWKQIEELKKIDIEDKQLEFIKEKAKLSEIKNFLWPKKSQTKTHF